MTEGNGKPDKKVLRGVIPEIVISAVLCVVLVVLFAGWAKTYKMPTWYSFAAAGISLALFMVALVSTVFVTGRELRNACKGLPVKTRGDAVVGTSSGRKLKDILIILAVVAVFALATVATVELIRRANGVGGSISSSVRYIWSALDSQHYLYIAENGYTPNTSEDFGRVVEIVFFPGYPFIVSLLGKLLGDYFAAGMLVSFLAFEGAAVLLYLIVEEEYSRQDAIAAVAALLVTPGAFFFIAPMTESLFLALTLACIYCIKKKYYFPAALFGAYAAFTRSAGVFVAIIFAYEALTDWIAAFANYRKAKKRLKNPAVAEDVNGDENEVAENAGTARKIPAPSMIRPNLILAVCVLMCIVIASGLLGYLAVNYAVDGDPFIFMKYQREHWNQNLGFFFGTAAYCIRYAVQYFKNPDQVGKAVALWCMNLFAIFGSLTLLCVKGRKLRAPYLVYSLVYLAFSLGATWLLSGTRYMVAMFTVPVMLGIGYEKKRVGKQVLFGLLAVLSVVYLIMFVRRWQVW